MECVLVGAVQWLSIAIYESGGIEGGVNMEKFQQSVTINQPVEQVFAFIRDTRNTARWHPSIVEARGDCLVTWYT